MFNVSKGKVKHRNFNFSFDFKENKMPDAVLKAFWRMARE
jgi:hypothetical protein